MKYAFFGTTNFSAGILRSLIQSSFPPSIVICNPDRPTGRKRILTPPQVKPLAVDSGIPVVQPERIDGAFIAAIADRDLEFAVLAAYGKILPKELLDVFQKGIVGVHVSLLPKYRGASPMQSAILGGEKTTGVTLYLMDELVDHGPVLAESEIPLDRKNFSELQAASIRAGSELLLRTLPEFAAGQIIPRAQKESEATYTKKFSAEDGFVPEDELARAERGDAPIAEKIDRIIRALNPEPGVWTMRSGKRIKLLEARLENGSLRLITIQRDGGLPEKV